MKKLLRGALLIAMVGLGGCTGTELFLVGSLLGGAGTSYGKPWLDKLLTPTPVPDPAKKPVAPVP